MTSTELEELLKKDSPSGYFEGQNPIYYRTHPFLEEVGVSVFRLYGSNIPFKPSLFSDGKPADVCLFNVILHETKCARDAKVPVSVSVGKFNEWFAKHVPFDYLHGPEVEGAPTKTSIVLMNKSPMPVDLRITDEFYLDLISMSLIYRGRKIKGYELLDVAYKIHIKTLSAFYRFGRKLKFLRFKMFEGLEGFFLWLLGYVWGISFSTDITVTERMFPHWKHFVCQPKDKPLKVFGFGYEASRKIVVIYSVIIIILVFCLFKSAITWLSRIVPSGNPYLLPAIITILVAVLIQPLNLLGVWMLQEILPLLIKAICLFLNRFKWWLLRHL